MYLLVGVIFSAGIILLSLYFFVFKTANIFVSILTVFTVFLLLVLTKFMHAIFVGIFVLCAGLFVIYFVNKNKSKNKD